MRIANILPLWTVAPSYLLLFPSELWLPVIYYSSSLNVAHSHLLLLPSEPWLPVTYYSSPLNCGQQSLITPPLRTARGLQSLITISGITCRAKWYWQLLMTAYLLCLKCGQVKKSLKSNHWWWCNLFHYWQINKFLLFTMVLLVVRSTLLAPFNYLHWYLLHVTQFFFIITNIRSEHRVFCSSDTTFYTRMVAVNSLQYLWANNFW